MDARLRTGASGLALALAVALVVCGIVLPPKIDDLLFEGVRADLFSDARSCVLL